MRETKISEGLGWKTGKTGSNKHMHVVTASRYPGCQCDIPAHNYAYSFEQNPEWPNYYATSVQIHDYLKKTSTKYNTDRYMNFNHEIQSAVWNELDGKWNIRIQNGSRTIEDKCDVFINAGGVLK